MKKLVSFCIGAVIIFTMGAPFLSAASEERTPRIVGGDKAPLDAWPFMVSLVDAHIDDPYYAHRCGGVLIADHWVLTAAHCVSDGFRNSQTDGIEVLVGAYDLLSNEGERIPLKRIITHPDYNSQTLDSDIALLELNERVDFEPIELVSSDNVLTGQNSIILGWGSLDSEGDDYPAVLQQATVPIISNKVCNQAYIEEYSYYNVWLRKWIVYHSEDQITANMLCAGLPEGGVDACVGDSGGPLIIEDQGQFRLAGIVSWGEGCALEGYYGVYTRVANFLPFIKKWVTPVASESCGDYNGDGIVDFDDLNEKYKAVNDELNLWLRECWYPKDACGDYTGNGKVNFKDWTEKKYQKTETFYDWIMDCWYQDTE